MQALWVKKSDSAQWDRQLSATVAALVGISPKDELEGMMAAQLFAAHNAAMECYRRAMLGEQTFEGRRENLNQGDQAVAHLGDPARRAQPPSRQRPAVVQGLRMLPDTKLERLPRMADFALWASACETAVWSTGTFWSAYCGNPGRSGRKRDRGRSGRTT